MNVGDAASQIVPQCAPPLLSFGRGQTAGHQADEAERTREETARRRATEERLHQEARRSSYPHSMELVDRLRGLAPRR